MPKGGFHVLILGIRLSVQQVFIAGDLYDLFVELGLQTLSVSVIEFEFIEWFRDGVREPLPKLKVT